MLAWLPAAAAPLLIHLLNRRKYREMRWAAMEYLMAAIVKSSRRMRIEQLLLLLLRTAVILLLTLALAKPFLSAIGTVFVPGARMHRVLVLDGSYSMAYKPADKTLFELAKERAVKIVRDSDKGDGFGLILLADPPRVVVGKAAFDADDFVKEIESLELPHGPADLSTTVEKVEQVIAQVSSEHPELSQREIYFLSDLGRNTWDAAVLEGDAASDLSTRLTRLSKQANMQVLPLVNTGRSDNLAITRFETADPFATVGQTVLLEVTIHNFGSTPRGQVHVELLVDARRVDQKSVDVPAGESSGPVTFAHRFGTTGDHAVEVRLTEDRLAIDDHRRLVLPVKEHLTALCIGGRQGSITELVAALDPKFRRESRSVIRPHVASESALLELDLEQFDCIFLCNIAQFTAGEARVLDNYVRQGGGLVLFLGDQVSADRYNRELASVAPEGVRLLPAQLGEAVHDGAYHHFDPKKYRHEIAMVWQGNPAAGLLAKTVAKYIRLELPEEKEGAGKEVAGKKDAAQARPEVALAFDNGDPAVVTQSIGRGRVVLVATAASTASMVDSEAKRPWTVMPGKGVYLPLVHSLWRYVVRGGLDERNVLVGEPIGSELRATYTGQPITVRAPGRAEIRVPLTSGPVSAAWSLDGTLASGFYEVTIGESGGEKMAFAVNVDARSAESELVRVNPDDLAAALTGGDWRSDVAGQASNITGQSTGMHKTMICLMLGLIFAESTLACWLGSRSA